MKSEIINKLFSFNKKVGIEYKRYNITILGIKFSFKRKNKTKIKVFEKYSIKDNSNKIYIKENGVLREVKERIPGLKIKLEGHNNTIIVEYPTCFIGSYIECCGNNGKIIIEKTKHKLIDLRIYMSSNVNEKPLENRYVHIKSNVSSGGGGGLSIFSWSENSKVIIGEDCMFSFGIKIFCGDGHLFKDKTTGKYINNYDGCYVEIGNHCWVGMNAVICKNTKIPNGCIIGVGSVVTKSIKEENSVLAGNPAKIVRKDIEWERQVKYSD